MKDYAELVASLRGWAEDDCGRAGVAINGAADAVEALMKERDDAWAYLVRNVLTPHGATPLPDLMGVCIQVDHITATRK